MATTTLKTSTLPREFVFNGSRIPDPDPQMSIDQVRASPEPSVRKGKAMSRSEMTQEELVTLFAMKATAPPPEANKLLVRHLQCKESIRLAGAVRQAMDRFAATDCVPLSTPSELLPPLG
jgi:hypothetical protein